MHTRIDGGARGECGVTYVNMGLTVMLVGSRPPHTRYTYYVSQLKGLAGLGHAHWRLDHAETIIGRDQGRFIIWQDLDLHA